MSSSVGIAAIWAGALVLCFVLVLRQLGRPLAGVFDAHRRRIEANIENDRADALERQNEAELVRATAAEHAERRKAQLRQETAEADAAAVVAGSTHEAQIAAEETVIAARAEGRATAAKERALRGEEGNAEELAVLMEAYHKFLIRTPYNRQVTLEAWLGEFRLGDGRLSR